MVVLMLFRLCALVLAEEKKTFNEINPFFKDEISIENIDSIKNKTFHSSFESFDIDQNGQKRYGDTYERCTLNKYWTFDNDGRVIKYKIEAIQGDRINNLNEYCYAYENNQIIIRYTNKTEMQEYKETFTIEIIHEGDCFIFVNNTKLLLTQNNSQINHCIRILSVVFLPSHSAYEAIRQ